FLLDALHRLGDIVITLDRTDAVELGVAAHRDERRPELVAGITDKSAHALHRGIPLFERSVDAIEHRVDRELEPPDLGARLDVSEALAKVAAGNAHGGLFDLPEAAERLGHEPAGAEGADRDDDEGECAE